jgi:hypothetical protein
MACDDYQLLRTRIDRGVTFVTLDNSPVNLVNMEMNAELLGFVT